MADMSTRALHEAERILAETFGGEIRLGEGESLGGSARSLVQRFPVVEGPQSAPASVIVKESAHHQFDPASADDSTWRFFNDWASVQFLDELAPQPPLVPALYGGSRETGLVVLEDVPSSVRLDHLLLGTDREAAQAGLLAYAEVHGRLHALAAERHAEYLRTRRRLGAAESVNPYYTYRWLPAALHAVTTLLDARILPGAGDELDLVANELVHPGPFLTLVQSDAAPDNILYDGATWRMIDFEGAHYTHALLEGAYCRMPFPTCWCVYRLPAALVERMEAVYRAELARGCPAAVDDRQFYRGVVGACVAWALNFHHMIRPLEKMLEQDRALVALTDRQRFLLYLHAAISAAETFDHLPAVAGTLRACAGRLAEQWPEAADPPYYPAFR
jgi:hypothetical protein